MSNKKLKNVLISAGGTAGHVFPAIEVAKEFCSRGYFIFFVTDRRMYDFVKKQPNFINKNIKLFCYRGKGFQRKNILQNCLSFVSLLSGLFQSFAYLIFNRPAIAIGFGGYITVPVLFACYILKIKVFIHEGNAILGKANKLLYRISKKLMTHFVKLEENGDKNFNYICVGMPVRKEIVDLNKFNYTKIKNKTINILITGGSLGAEIMAFKIANTIIRFSPELKIKLSIVQQVRRENFSELKKIYDKNNINAELEIFIKNMAKYLKWADLIICRCGAGTLAENLIVGKPAVMIPLANSADNHQLYNAKLAEDRGVGWVITEEELENFTEIKNKLEHIIRNIEKFQKTSEIKKQKVILDSASRIADITSSYITLTKESRERNDTVHS